MANLFDGFYIGHVCTRRKKEKEGLYCKIFLESDEKITTKTTFPSSYKGGRMLNLESPFV